jgi:hypothetical protein
MTTLTTATTATSIAMRPRSSYEAVLHRLNQASVKKHFDAYTDVDWDAPDNRIDPDDPRWEIPLAEPIGASAWYRAQPLSIRTRMGLDLAAMRLRMGIEFENVLSRGLLEFALGCPNGSPAFRYAYHEAIEEGQHSLMFQEFVNRAGTDPRGLPALRRLSARTVPGLARRFPELFFVFVLAGEVPIDVVQRRELHGSHERHPLLRRIMQIHVTEEARHVCFAEHYLREHVPRLSRFARCRLQLMAPFVTHENAQLMLRAPDWLLQRYGVPRAAAQEIKRGPVARQLAADTVRPLLDIFQALGLVTGATAPLWHALGYSEARARPLLGPGPGPREVEQTR